MKNNERKEMEEKEKIKERKCENWGKELKGGKGKE